MADSTYDLIQLLEVTSSTSTLEITGIPNTYRHLAISLVTNGLTNDSPLFRVNNNSGSTAYASVTVVGQGNGSKTSAYLNQSYIEPYSSQEGNHQGAHRLEIFDYANTGSGEKTFLFNGGAFYSTDSIYVYSGRFLISGAISSVQVLSYGDTFTSGTKLGVWGIL